MNISKACKFSMVEAGATSAGTALESDSVDMQGFEGVVFFGRIATANAANTAKLQQSSDNGSSDGWSDLEGTALAVGDNGDSFLLDCYRPQKRYVRCVITRSGANTVTGDVVAVQYGAAAMPVAQPATVDSELHVSPAEGTA